MWRYLLKRLCLVGVVVVGVTLITFALMNIAPGDPALVIAEARYGTDLTPEQVEQIRIEEGFDSPIYVQYIRWLEHILRLDLGRSLVTYDPVLDEIMSRLPATLLLAFSSLIFSLIIALPLGVVSAIRKGTWVDHTSMTVALLGVSMPNFWLGLILIWVFAVGLGMLPSFGFGGIEHLILPTITLGASMAAVTTRLMRSSMIEVLNQDYIVAARAKGLDERTVLLRHGLKNALLPVITFAGLQLGFLLGGTVIVESVFGWPGLGKLLVSSVYVKDFPMIQGCVLFIAIMFALVNLMVDLAYAFIDPRIRYESAA
jgi:peptide/nickel transport system permease protein